MSEDNRTPEEIERDIEANRAKLGQTIDKLQRRVAPERVAGEIGDQLRVFGSETVDLLSRDAVEREHHRQKPPVPIAWKIKYQSWV